MVPKPLAGLAVVLLAAAAARADSWAMPTPKDFRSASGGHVFHVVPAEGNWFKPAEGVLLSRDRDGKEKVLWKKRLVNLPHQAFVADDGRHVVTIDTYANLGFQHSLVLYGEGGKLLADYELEDLLKGEEIRGRVTRSVSSRWWASSTKFAFGRDGKAFTLSLKWGRTITLDLATGKIDPKVRETPPTCLSTPARGSGFATGSTAILAIVAPKGALPCPITEARASRRRWEAVLLLGWAACGTAPCCCRNRLRLRLGLGGCGTENNGDGFNAPGVWAWG
jgi:hypothetical protein